MRIAYVGGSNNHFVPPYVRAMVERGHEVRLFDLAGVLAKPDAIPCEVVDVGASVHPKQGRTKWRYALAARHLRREVAAYRPEVVHAHYASSAGIVCALAGLRGYLLSLRGSDILVRAGSPVWRAALVQALGRSSLVHAVSDELADGARALVPDADVRVLTQGLDLRQFPFAPRADWEDPPRLLCTRTLGPIYSNETLVRAVTILAQRGTPVRLTLAAGGPDRARLGQIAEAEGVAEYIAFLDGYDNDALPALMAAHDAYVSASLSDGTSISLLEAMAAGLFPIVTRIESNEAWVTDGETAQMFSPENPGELAGSIIASVTLGPRTREAALRYNRATVETRGDRAANMDALEGWYAEVLRAMPSGMLS
ncbi:MAG: glycosyltransferase [Bacteroidota bacterium]